MGSHRVASTVRVGDRFLRWVVLSEAPPKVYTRSVHRRWFCRCDCGTERSVPEAALIKLESNSCGCYKAEKIAAEGVAGGKKFSIHGESGLYSRVTPEYRNWRAMKTRCLNPKSDSYSYYGAKGIKICARWEKDYTAFLEDMGRRPSPSHSIERLDVNGDYGPDNCVWADKKTQARNRSSNTLFEFQGKVMTLVELAELSPVTGQSIQQRIRKRGWSVEAAVLTPATASGGILRRCRNSSSP